MKLGNLIGKQDRSSSAPNSQTEAHNAFASKYFSKLRITLCQHVILWIPTTMNLLTNLINLQVVNKPQWSLIGRIHPPNDITEAR